MHHGSRLLIVFTTAVLLSVSFESHGATVDWAAQGNRAVVLANTSSAVPSGSLVRLGYFDIGNSEIATNTSNLIFLDSHFVEFDNCQMGAGTAMAGTFACSSANSGENFPGQPIYIWVFNTSVLSDATQHGIFDAPTNTAWIFPAEQPIPWFTSLDMEDADMQPVVGLLGGSVTIDGTTFGSTAVLAVIGTNEVANGGTVQFSAEYFGVNEAETTTTVTVVRSGGSGDISINFATSNRTARAGINYEATSGTLDFTNGQTSATFGVTIHDDMTFTGNRTVRLSLSDPTGNATLGPNSNAVLTIIERQLPPGPERLDFLQRQLDAIFDCAGNTALSLLASNRATAAADFASCVSAAQQLLTDAQAQGTIDALGSKIATSLQKRIAALLKTLSSVGTLLDDASQTNAKALKGLMKATSALTKTKKLFLKFFAQAPLVMLEELKGKGGFHGTNEVVCYRVHVFNSTTINCGTASIAVTNLPASEGFNVVQPGINQINATDFCITTGSEQGVARITATACDNPSSVVLFNLGR